MPNKKYEKRKRRVELNQMKRIVKECNYLMRKDDLWRGRFEARIVSRRTHIHDDKSGLWSVYFIVIVDNAEKEVLKGDWIYHSKSFGSDTGFSPRHIYNLDLSKVMYLFNDAIVYCSNAWTSEIEPYDLAELPEYDFTKKGSYHMPMEEIIKQIENWR